MPKPTIQVDDKEVLAFFNNMQKGMTEKVLGSIAFVASLPIENEWARTVPFKTGQYKRSIRTEIVEKTKTHATAQVGTDITDPPYPEFLEYGTARMKARPSAGPAYLRKRKAATREAQKALQAIIKKLSKKR